METEDLRADILQTNKEQRLSRAAILKDEAAAKANRQKVKHEANAKEFTQNGYSNVTLKPMKLRYCEVRSPRISTLPRGERLTRGCIQDQLIEEDVWENLATHTSSKLATKYEPKCRWCRRLLDTCVCKCKSCHCRHRNVEKVCQCKCKKLACKAGCLCGQKERTPKGYFSPVTKKIMGVWYYTWLLIRGDGNNVAEFYEGGKARRLEEEFYVTLLPRHRFSAINSALEGDIDFIHTSFRTTFADMVRAGAEACTDETILAYEGDDCKFKIYMPSKPHKWGILTYGLVVKLELSRKPFMLDFEPHMSAPGVKAKPVSACHALHVLVDRNNTNLVGCGTLHLAVDSAFGTVDTFNWLATKSTYVTASIGVSKFGQDKLSVLAYQLPIDHWRLFYSEKDEKKTISVCSDRGRKAEEKIVLTMSNAYEPVVSETEGIGLTRPSITYEDALSISHLTNGAMIRWCTDCGVEYIPGQPFENVKSITGFDVPKYMLDLNSGIENEKEKEAGLSKHTVEELKAMCRTLGLAVKGKKKAIIERILQVKQPGKALDEVLMDLVAQEQSGKPDAYHMRAVHPFAYYLYNFNAQDCFDHYLYELPWTKSTSWRQCYISSMLWMATVNAYSLYVENRCSPEKLYDESIKSFVKLLAISKLQELT